jgi:hypothetical protein
MGRDALARRVHSIAYTHNGRDHTATVGEHDADFYPDETVMAIIAFPDVYLICSTVHGYLKVGETPMVGKGSVHRIEHFAP